ncbi:MAG TPA: dTDP-glucose 4,6-dehydratase [Acidobacteriota bacterium]|nr:dTDP-glucose 4,6-dehydratase [Acidobacteriota bacterium]
MKLFVTGGAGFIGSNFVRLMLTRPDIEILNYDSLTYAGNLENLKDVENHPRYRFVKADITDAEQVNACLAAGFDAIVNFAAETHVDRSIVDSSTFIKSNVLGVQVLLEAARTNRVSRFVQISTDEVYGSLGPSGLFTEQSPLAPNSPYAASKASADLLVRAYAKTYGLDTVITRCSNNYGPYQFPEKLIPVIILNAIEDRPLPVYGDGLYTRDWIHVEDHCRAIETVLRAGRPGGVYNIGSNQEMKNIDLVKLILDILNKPYSLIQHIADRPGHDRRYAIDAGKIRQELNWTPQMSFETALRQTVEWYLANPEWVSRVRSGAYKRYYQ